MEIYNDFNNSPEKHKLFCSETVSQTWLAPPWYGRLLFALHRIKVKGFLRRVTNEKTSPGQGNIAAHRVCALRTELTEYAMP